MKTSPLPRRRTLAVGTIQNAARKKSPEEATKAPRAVLSNGIRIICLYPSVDAGKLAREWIERTIRDSQHGLSIVVEYFNYTQLSHDLISWNAVLSRHSPDLILMVGDGTHPLEAGLRNSLRKLFSQWHPSKSPLVIFRDLEPSPSVNTRILLDYVSVLTLRNHCELNAMDGNGTPIDCFKHHQRLLQGRRHQE